MKQIRESYKRTKELYHAYGLLGDRKNVENDLLAFLEQDLKFPINDNPDFWRGEYNIFKIKDSRSLNDAHLNMPVKYGRKVFVIFANAITKDAQNSLLKIFEEPKANTVFFLVLPSFLDMLPTLKSRLIISTSEHNRPVHQNVHPALTKAGKGDKAKSLSADTFLNAKMGQRLNTVAKIIKDIKEERINKSFVIAFLKDIEKKLQEKKNLLAIEDMERAISYANDESPSIKVILEHLCFVL